MLNNRSGFNVASQGISSSNYKDFGKTSNQISSKENPPGENIGSFHADKQGNYGYKGQSIYDNNYNSIPMTTNVSKITDKNIIDPYREFRERDMSPFKKDFKDYSPIKSIPYTSKYEEISRESDTDMNPRPYNGIKSIKISYYCLNRV